MCGIAGIAGSDLVETDIRKVEAMSNSIRRRGPDDAGIETWNGAILAHRRLSIFDLTSAGHQPMKSATGDIGIVFNGAIYNFRQLRSELRSAGFDFKSETDTEVLLTGYSHWGIDLLLEKIDGMFAFAIWDSQSETLTLVRDRLGVKPLVFATSRDNDRIAFASTVKALRRSGFVGEISSAGLVEYLEFGFLADDNSIFEGVEKVAAGEVVQWRPKEISRYKYWSLSGDRRSDSISFQDAVAHVESLLLSAVEKRLHADVPVGALLSGGIDSSLICWAISKLGGDVTAYTVGSPGDPSDESKVASETARRLNIKHRVLQLQPENRPDIKPLTEAFGEPFACASALGMLKISETVSRSAKVLLTGDGGDDIFLGYPEHRHFYLSGGLASILPDASTKYWRSMRDVVPRIGPLKRGVSFLDYSFGGIGAVAQARDGLPFYQSAGILGPKLEPLRFPDRAEKWSVERGRNLLNRFLEYDRRTRFVGEYLPKVDGSTMYHAIEARSPFLDTGLWEFADRLPFSVRLYRGRLKAILRSLVAKQIDPNLARIRKQGFIVPVNRWVAREWYQDVRDVLSDSMLAKESYIRVDETLNALDRSRDAGVAPRQLWFLYVLESWLRNESDSVSSRP